MYKKGLYYLLLMILVTWSCKTQQENNNIVNVHFEGKQFDSINLVIKMADRTPSLNFPGKSKNGKDWTFSYPDSLYEKHSAAELRLPPVNDTLVETIAFSALIEGDTLRVASYCFTRGVTEIYADYSKTNIYPDMYISNPNNPQVPLVKTQYQYVFMIPPGSDRQIISVMEAFRDRYCMPNTIDMDIYAGQLETFVNLTKKYPDSHFLSYFMFGNHTLFKSKSDINRIFSCFTSEIRRSYLGSAVNDFLASTDTKYEYDIFENSYLPVWNSASTEYLVQDTTRYNLVLFSASWCIHCHNQIPLLKEIYEKYNGNLIFTYVSLDEEETETSWSDVMTEKSIPWRSLMAADSIGEIKDRYFAYGVPHTILVYPGGKKAEIIDVRVQEDYNKLVALVQ